MNKHVLSKGGYITLPQRSKRGTDSPFRREFPQSKGRTIMYAILGLLFLLTITQAIFGHSKSEFVQRQESIYFEDNR